jgi:hypothetical protein
VNRVVETADRAPVSFSPPPPVIERDHDPHVRHGSPGV